MSIETNEKELNYANSKNDEIIQNEIDNAFSDLISKYFEEDNNKQSVDIIQSETVLDWDSVSNGQLYTNLAGGIIKTTQNNMQTEVETNNNSGLLFSNLENLNGQYINESQLEDMTINQPIVELSNNQNVQEIGKTQIYNELGNIDTEKIVKTAYNVGATTGELLKGINNNNETNIQNVNEAIQSGNSFKLTQANLPAKIGFWTKVRNFFISDSKIGYSVQQSNEGNTGVWNRIQNFFSFGKSDK